MAMNAADGKRFHSASRARLHDEMAAKKKNPPTHMQKPTEAAASQGAGPADLSHMNMKDVVAKHGPAHKVEIEHDHASGKHHVTSHHKGGHHKSSHGSADEAHMHGAQAAGVETPDTDEEGAQPYAGTESPEEEGAEAQIPGM